jgi:hypothetical protein
VVQAGQSIKARLYLENKTKRAGGMAGVVERLHSKCQALNPHPSTHKQTKNQQEPCYKQKVTEKQSLPGMGTIFLFSYIVFFFLSKN